MFCKQCGKPINDGEELCEECKTSFTAGNSQGSQSYNNPNFNNGNANNNRSVEGQNYTNQNYNNQGYNNQNNNKNQNNGQYNNNSNTQKSKIAAGLLGIFLGTLGIHNFYLGFTGKAVAQLLITLLSCGFLAIVSSIWGLIEGILILTGSINVDANGVPLKD